MWEDPIVEKIHKIREDHARKFNFELQAIYDPFGTKTLLRMCNLDGSPKYRRS